jgi:hypothetical protein
MMIAARHLVPPYALEPFDWIEAAPVLRRGQTS